MNMRFLCMLILACLAVTQLSGQGMDPVIYAQSTIRWAALFSFAVPQALYEGGRVLLNSEADPTTDLWISSVFLTGNVPLFLVPGDGTAWLAGLQLGGWGLRAPSPFTGMFAGDVERLGFYGLLDISYLDTYETYRRMRTNAAPGSYTEGWRGYDLGELLSAPFDPGNLALPIVWGSILGETAANTLMAFLTTPQESAVWTTGRAYIGDVETPIWASLAERATYAVSSNTLISIGEECVFRGVIFEEIRDAWGEWPARLIDMLVFPSMHIFNWISKGQTFWQIVPQYLYLILDAFLLDTAYLMGGLRASIALHCWLNVSNRLLDWAFGAGAPPTNVADMEPRDLPLSAGVSASGFLCITLSFSL